MRRWAVFLFVLTLAAAVGSVVLVGAPRTRIADWPAPVAVIGESGDARRPVGYLGVADPVHGVVVTVPADAIVEIPGKGFLRAHHAWRLGGSATARETLGLLFGVDVPFAAVGSGSTYKDVLASSLRIDAPSRVEGPLQATLRNESEAWRRVKVELADNAADPVSVRLATLALGGRVSTRLDRSSAAQVRASPSPTAPPRVDPGSITVDVLNGGEVRGAAAAAAAKLETSGYEIGVVDDFEPKRAESRVYFAPGKQAAGAQVGAELGHRAKLAPREVTMRAGVDVLVVLGNDVRPQS